MQNINDKSKAKLTSCHFEVRKATSKLIFSRGWMAGRENLFLDLTLSINKFFTVFPIICLDKIFFYLFIYVCLLRYFACISQFRLSARGHIEIFSTIVCTSKIIDSVREGNYFTFWMIKMIRGRELALI